MIFYFTGTGNSLWVAETVAESFTDKTIAISDYFNGDTTTWPEFTLSSGEYVGFVFPVHAWGIPPLMHKFIERLRLNSYKDQTIFGIFTCGDECGYTKEMFVKLIQAKGWECHHTYSVQMPNTYIVFPGFDVDSKELETQKLENAKNILPGIINAIRDNKPIHAYKKGSMSFLKSRIIYPQFCKHAMSSRPFYSTGACTSCGLCARVCPTKNITVTEKPVWGNHCTQCLACIHRCPERAIEYGKVTRNKGRYYFKKNNFL
ncbi:MAG: EFR1 family ferrodoxin [Tannerella sp.]|jgi:ferredoxin|nr:EFR1 family ferrodoxin [Tannerella sp.]